MKLLLDTHVWVGSIRYPERLARSVRRALENRGNEVWISAVSALEFISICRKRELRTIRDPLEWLIHATAGPFREAPVTFEVALECGRFTLPHDDPADRIIVGTARVLGLTLITSDVVIIESGLVPTIDNR